MIIIPLILANMIIPFKDDGTSDYLKENYADANAFFTEKQLDNPDDDRLKYNMGNTYYKMKDFEKAASMFDSVLASSKDDLLKEKAHYNLGNTKFRQGDLLGASENYTKALELDSLDRDAAFNLELVQKLIKEQMEKNSERQEQNQEGDGQGEKKEGEQGQEGEQKEGAQGQEGNQQEAEEKEGNAAKEEEGKEDEEGKDQGAVPKDAAKEENEDENKDSTGGMNQAGEEQEGDLTAEEMNYWLDKAKDVRPKRKGTTGRRYRSEKDW